MTGICEWHYYEPNVDGVINPFKLEYWPKLTGRTVFTEGYTLDDFLPKRSLVADLQRGGVRSYAHGPGSFYPSDYGIHFDSSAEIVGYRSAQEAVDHIISIIRRTSGKQFHRLYIDTYDSLRHSTGPYSPEADAEAIRLLGELGKLLQLNDTGQTLLIFTADHGQVPIDAETEVVINEEIPAIETYLARTKKGALVRFGGGPRDLLLYAQPGATEELAGLVRTKLSGIAEVYTQSEAAALGILGPVPLGGQFKARIGDVLILPHLGHSVVWHEPGLTREIFKGHHGGLTRQEMEIPLCFLRV